MYVKTSSLFPDWGMCLAKKWSNLVPQGSQRKSMPPCHGRKLGRRGAIWKGGMMYWESELCKGDLRVGSVGKLLACLSFALSWLIAAFSNPQKQEGSQIK